jgi:hypothetical protein
MIDADRLSAATVLDPDGTSVRLGSLWEDQPAVVPRGARRRGATRVPP